MNIPSLPLWQHRLQLPTTSHIRNSVRVPHPYVGRPLHKCRRHLATLNSGKEQTKRMIEKKKEREKHKQMWCVQRGRAIFKGLRTSLLPLASSPLFRLNPVSRTKGSQGDSQWKSCRPVAELDVQHDRPRAGPDDVRLMRVLQTPKVIFLPSSPRPVQALGMLVSWIRNTREDEPRST